MLLCFSVLFSSSWFITTKPLPMFRGFLVNAMGSAGDGICYTHTAKLSVNIRTEYAQACSKIVEVAF